MDATSRPLTPAELSAQLDQLRGAQAELVATAQRLAEQSADLADDIAALTASFAAHPDHDIAAVWHGGNCATSLDHLEDPLAGLPTRR